MGTDQNNMGVIPRAVCDIFKIAESKEDWDLKVTVSFMELYQEQLYDLLSDKQRNQSIVDIKEDNKGVKVFGVTERLVMDADTTLQCLMEGSMRRATGATAMNACSSRSHAIFTLSLQQQKKHDPNHATTAKFHLVDLAGSERSKKTQATGERFKEGININKGLLALGNVISQLGEGNSASYIGYRDSKLTRLLQDSLGGNSMTLVIACVSPADYNLDETLSTLRYADRARKIKNKPIINQDPKVAEIIRLNKLVKELRLALAGCEINIPRNHNYEELQEKYQSSQIKLRELTEKLNSNLIEIIFMHERAELAELAREKMKTGLAEVLEDLQQLFKCFDIDPNDSEIHRDIKLLHRAKWENIYQKILDIQNDQKKTSEELLQHGISSCSETSVKVENEQNIAVEEHYSTEDVNPDDPENLEYIDKKHEEHTMRQAERNDEVQNINRELAIKESLISELVRNSTRIMVPSKELQEMEHEIKMLQAEKEELLQTLHNVNANIASSKFTETRPKKVQELEKKISELSSKCLEQNKIIKMKEKLDHQVKNLSNEILSLKQARVKVIKQMRNEANRFTKWKQTREKEFNKLKSQDQKRATQMVRLQIQHKKQQNVMKRKMEEACAINKRLKEALDKQKKAIQHREKMSNNKEGIQTWVIEELEVLLSTVDAEYSLQKLMQDRAFITSQLDKLKNSSDANEKDITELIDFLDLRNTQIVDLQQKILESDQENRANTRWQTIQTMSDAKTALRVLFDIIAKDRKAQCAKEINYTDLLEKNETQIKELKEEIQRYKDQCEQLEQKEKSTLKPKNNEKKEKRMYENSYVALSDDSIIEDDIEKDPDWTRTPLYNRVRKLLDAPETSSNRRSALKRSSDGDIKCACKTKCITRMCSCRKNNIVCNNCSCNPKICQNKDKENLTRTLFSDVIEDETPEEMAKRPRLTK